MKNESQEIMFEIPGSGLDAVALQSASFLTKCSSTFPATRYFGSKKKLLPWLSKIFQAESFSSALDPFGGTGVVSNLLAQQGKSVFYRDFFKWSTTCASVLLEQQAKLLSDSDLSEFLDEVRPIKGFIANEFKDAYYSDHENKWLDGACIALNRLSNVEIRDQLWYLLIQASLRKRPFNMFHRQNLHLRQSKLAMPTFGNHSTWNRSFQSHMRELHTECYAFKTSNPKYAKVLPAGDVLAAAPQTDLVYLDPPYMSPDRYSESYLDRYHFIEGMLDYGNWPNRVLRDRRKISIDACEEAQQWSDKEFLTDLMLGTVAAYSNSIVMLSYAENSIPSKKLIHEYFKDIFSTVTLYRRERTIAMSARPLTELVFVGRP